MALRIGSVPKPRLPACDGQHVFGPAHWSSVAISNRDNRRRQAIPAVRSSALACGHRWYPAGVMAGLVNKLNCTCRTTESLPPSRNPHGRTNADDLAVWRQVSTSGESETVDLSKPRGE